MDNWKRPYSLLEWLFLLIDLTGLPEIYQIVHELLNWKVRGLSKREKDLIRSVFKETVKINTVRVNGDNRIFSKRLHIAFVTFHSVHFHNGISDGLLIHEIMHVWQYERFGSAYIVRALHAQRSEMGYDYGGKATLTYKKRLMDFNFEQMAEIVRHGFELDFKDELYNYFIAQLQE